MSKEVCKIFKDADNFFKGGNPDLDKINKEIGENIRDCLYGNKSDTYTCKTDFDGINALYCHVVTELHKIPIETQEHENNDYQYIEYAIIWIGYKLFQTGSYNSPNLIDFYNNHLTKSILPSGLNYILEKKKHLLYANLELINELYILFNDMCNIITDPNIYTESDKIKSNVSKFQDTFTSIYNETKECYPYFKLLKNFKKIYDDYRNNIIYTIVSNKFMGALTIMLTYLNLPFTELKIPDWNDEFMEESLEIDDFMTSGCAKLHSKYIEHQQQNISQDLPKEQFPSGSNKSGNEGNQQPSEFSNPATQKQNERPESEQQSPKQEPPPKTALPPAAPQTPSTESSKNLPLTGPGSSTTPSTPKKTQPLTKIEPAQSTSTKLGNAQQTPIKASGSIPIKMPAQQAPTKPESTKPTPAQPVILQKTPEQKRLKPSAPPALPKPQRQLPSQPPQKKDTSLQKPQTGGLSHQNGSGGSKSEQKGSGSEKGNADGGKGTPSIDTGGSRGESGKSGGKPKDNTPKKTDHVNNSPPGSKAPIQEKRSGNQRNGLTTAQSVKNNGNDAPSGTKNGTRDTNNNAGTGKSKEGKLNGIPVNHEADNNKKIDQHQGTDNKQGSSRDRSGSSGIGSNISGSGIDTSPSPQDLQPIPSLLPLPITPSLPLSQSPSSQTPPVTSSGTQAASPKPVPQPQLQPQRQPSINLPSSAGGKAETAMSSIESTLSGQNDASKKLSRARRSLNPGSSISTSTNGLGSTSDTSPSIALSPSVPRTISIEPITANASEGEKGKSDISSIENTLNSQDAITKRSSRRKRSATTESSISISSSGQGVTSDASSSTTVADVKINEKSSIWCIGSNKKFNIIGIGIIGISIFVFLAFMFKYLPFGSRKKSKKKKITKKVINLVDGRKMEKTFIKSIDRGKKSKIIANSGDNKKIAKIIINSDDNINPIKKVINPWNEKRKTHATINSEYKKKYIKSVINSGP
ncbi:CIR protein [Plasmodium chabaudi chabaudi]|uniref:CIR protein n=1 Tax=Plasmodium chabaudi chabaudi TaxID=31271 RepID=A0A4V0K567_PLACU|nr:CIR protein [Plasmodium chabaudi chabaudi]VTZ67602.1 CIR protein [Plasmodium chabaudi chabaudi]|eukprot:XP_016653367.1 CIR protein [Plasmodium chabaudi chabaudi]